MRWLMDRMWPNLSNDFRVVSTALVTRLGRELNTTTVISLIASGHPADTDHIRTLPKTEVAFFALPDLCDAGERAVTFASLSL
jgi:hypothetical protein